MNQGPRGADRNRIKSTDVGGNLEQKGKETHYLLRPEGEREKDGYERQQKM